MVGGRRGNSKNILFLGNFRHYPNVDAVHNFMQHCWGRVSKEVPDAIFHAIGFDPPAELLNLRNDRVVIREGGEHSDVREVYRNSDVFAAPLNLVVSGEDA